MVVIFSRSLHLKEDVSHFELAQTGAAFTPKAASAAGLRSGCLEAMGLNDSSRAGGSASRGEEPARHLFQLVPLCSHLATSMLKKGEGKSTAYQHSSRLKEALLPKNAYFFFHCNTSVFKCLMWKFKSYAHLHSLNCCDFFFILILAAVSLVSVVRLLGAPCAPAQRWMRWRNLQR